jgi:hypothetical protein
MPDASQELGPAQPPGTEGHPRSGALREAGTCLPAAYGPPSLRSPRELSLRRFSEANPGPIVIVRSAAVRTGYALPRRNGRSAPSDLTREFDTRVQRSRYL